VSPSLWGDIFSALTCWSLAQHHPLCCTLRPYTAMSIPLQFVTLFHLSEQTQNRHSQPKNQTCMVQLFTYRWLHKVIYTQDNNFIIHVGQVIIHADKYFLFFVHLNSIVWLGRGGWKSESEGFRWCEDFWGFCVGQGWMKFLSRD